MNKDMAWKLTKVTLVATEVGLMPSGAESSTTNHATGTVSPCMATVKTAKQLSMFAKIGSRESSSQRLQSTFLESTFLEDAPVSFCIRVCRPPPKTPLFGNLTWKLLCAIVTFERLPAYLYGFMCTYVYIPLSSVCNISRIYTKKRSTWQSQTEVGRIE